MITATKAREILSSARFNPKTDKRMAIIAEQGSLEYWEVQMKVMLSQLNEQANTRVDHLDVDDYKERMLLIIQHAVMCIDEVDTRSTATAPPVNWPTCADPVSSTSVQQGRDVYLDGSELRASAPRKQGMSLSPSNGDDCAANDPT